MSYTNDEPLYWKTEFGPTGRLEAFIKADKRAPTGGWVSDEVTDFDISWIFLETHADFIIRTEKSTTAFLVLTKVAMSHHLTITVLCTVV